MVGSRFCLGDGSGGWLCRRLPVFCVVRETASVGYSAMTTQRETRISDARLKELIAHWGDYINGAGYDTKLALRELAAMRREWQPIETAPKYQVVLLAGRWLSGRWEVATGEWLISRWPFVGEGQPTHWMPLPAPPERAAAPTEQTAGEEG